MGLRRLVVKPSADPVEWAWLREQLHRLLGEPAVPAAPVASNAESRLNAVDPRQSLGGLTANQLGAGQSGPIGGWNAGIRRRQTTSRVADMARPGLGIRM